MFAALNITGDEEKCLQLADSKHTYIREVWIKLLQECEIYARTSFFFLCERVES